MPSPFLLRNNKNGQEKEEKQIESKIGVREQNVQRVTSKHKGNDGTENGFFNINRA